MKFKNTYCVIFTKVLKNSLFKAIKLNVPLKTRKYYRISVVMLLFFFLF